MNRSNITKDLLVALKNGYSNNNTYTYCKFNSFCIELLWVLYKEELIFDFFVQPNNNKIKIRLKYFKKKPLLTNLTLISKPSLICFEKNEDLNTFYKKFDYFFISTSIGVLSSRFIEKKIKTGGQLLFGLKLNI